MPRIKAIVSTTDNLGRAIAAIETLRKGGAHSADVSIGDIRISGTFSEHSPAPMKVQKLSAAELEKQRAKELEDVTYGSA